MSSESVSLADVLDDQQWFAIHRTRQYRLRRGWAVRRYSRNGLFLRTPIADDHSDPNAGEGLAETAWWTAACPTMSPLARKQQAKAARWRRKPLRSAASAAAAPTNNHRFGIPPSGTPP